MNNILKKVNQYLNESDVTPIKSLNENILLVVVETLDEMGVTLSKEQQKALLLNISNVEV